MQGPFLLMQNTVLIGFTAEYGHVLTLNEAVPTGFWHKCWPPHIRRVTLGYVKWRKDTYRNSQCDTVKRWKSLTWEIKTLRPQFCCGRLIGWPFYWDYIPRPPTYAHDFMVNHKNLPKNGPLNCRTGKIAKAYLAYYALVSEKWTGHRQQRRTEFQSPDF